jgi:hypothetical protein
MIKCKEKNCIECFNEENYKYIECLQGKVSKYGLASYIANYLTISILNLDDYRPGTVNWGIIEMIDHAEEIELDKKIVDLAIATYKEIFKDLLKKDEEELRKIYS